MLSNLYHETFSRQSLLKEIGVHRQEKIASYRFLVIGAGGLGCPAILYLSAAGATHITVADADEVSRSNLGRQILHTERQLDNNKAQSVQKFMQKNHPLCSIHSIPNMLAGAQLLERVAQHDLVLDCTDNLKSRLRISDACYQTHTPLIFGSAIRFSGQVGLFTMQSHTPCLRCLFEEDEASNDVKAAQVGVFSPMTGLIGTLMACEAAKLATGIPSTIRNQLLCIDQLRGDFRTIKLKVNPHCIHQHH